MSIEQNFENLIKERNGLLKYSDLIQVGYNQRQIRNLESNNIIKKVSRGIYYHKDYFPDMLKVYQIENKKLIYSHETAAYLHNLTDRFPRMFSVTTESGYHLRKSNELNVFYIKKDYFELGVEERIDMSGNIVKVYNKERTICDIIRNKSEIEQQVYVEVIQNYFKGKIKLNRLSQYAKILGIRAKVFEIVSLMTKP